MNGKESVPLDNIQMRMDPCLFAGTIRDECAGPGQILGRAEGQVRGGAISARQVVVDGQHGHDFAQARAGRERAHIPEAAGCTTRSGPQNCTMLHARLIGRRAADDNPERFHVLNLHL